MRDLELLSAPLFHASCHLSFLAEPANVIWPILPDDRLAFVSSQVTDFRNRQPDLRIGAGRVSGFMSGARDPGLVALDGRHRGSGAAGGKVIPLVGSLAS